MFFLCLGILGLSQALINALPVEVSGIPTDGRNALAPVSYTHLDVYKRQLEELRDS